MKYWLSLSGEGTVSKRRDPVQARLLLQDTGECARASVSSGGASNGIFGVQEAVTEVTLVQLSGCVGSRLAEIRRRGGTLAPPMVGYRSVGEATACRKTCQFSDSGNFQQDPCLALIAILRPPGRRTPVHLFPDRRTGLPTMHCRSSWAMCIVSWDLQDVHNDSSECNA